MDKWIKGVSEWLGSEVQTRDCRVVYGGCLVGYVGTLAGLPHVLEILEMSLKNEICP